MYSIVKNNEQVAAKFILDNIGTTPDKFTVADLRNAQNILFERLDKLSQIQQLVTGSASNASVDIPTVLAGNETQYIQSLLAKRENLQHIQDKLNPQEKSRLAEMLLGLGVAVTLPGVSVRQENRTYSAEDFKEGKDRPLTVILGKGAMNFTAKVGSLLMPQAVVQLNVNDRETKLLSDAHKIGEALKSIPTPAKMEDFTKIDPSFANNPTVKFYLENQQSIPKANMADVIAYNKLLETARAEKGTEIKGVEATLGLFGIGVGASATKIDTEFVGSDGKVRRRVIDGIEQRGGNAVRSVEKTADDKFEYTLRNIPGLKEKLQSYDPSNGKIIENADGTITFTTEKVINIKANIDVDDKGGETISYGFQEVKNATKTTEPKVTETKTVEGEKLAREKAGETVADKIYSLNRRDPKFDKIIVNISK